MSSSLSDATWRPTRTGTALVVLGTLAVSLALARPLGLTNAVGLAWTAAVPFALGLWLTTLDDWRLAARYVAGLAVLPLGAGVAVGSVYTAVTLFGALFPVPTAAQIAQATLVVLGRLAVVLGLTVGALGATASVADLADRDSLRSFFWIAVRATLVAVAAAVALLALAVLGHVEIAPLGQSVNDVLTDGLGALSGALLTPSPTRPHLFSLAALLVAASLVVARTLGSLPLAELLDAGRAAGRARSALHRFALLAIVVLFLGTFTRFAFTSRQLTALLPPAAYRLLVDVTTITVLRRLLVAVTVGGVVVSSITYLVRRLARASAGAFLARHAPSVAGATLVGGVFLVHGPLVRTTRSFVLETLPYTFAGFARTQSAAILDYYGTLPLAAAALAALLVTASAALFGARLGVWLRVLPANTFGPALAAGGLFVATAFAGTADAVPPWLFFAGVVTALLVWDAGEYATQLGEEVGRHASTVTVEGVHVAGGLLVGVAASGVALAAASYGSTISFSNPTTLPVAVVGVGVALAALVFALR